MIGSLCLTLDIDWAHDQVIVDTLELLAKADARATWFVTHATPVVQDIRAAGHALGLHPNFNPLLEGADEGSAASVLDAIQAVAPEAVCIRSHSLTRSSRLAALFQARGLTHESNLLIPGRVAPALAPWRDWSGLIHVPIRWEDDVRLVDESHGEPADLLESVELLTVDFHPIHLFLNSTSLNDYDAARGDMGDPKALLRRRRPAGSGGARDRLLKLLEKASRLSARRPLMAQLQPPKPGAPCA